MYRLIFSRFFGSMMMSLNFHALWYTTSMHYISLIFLHFPSCFFILMCPLQLTSIDFKMQCIALEWVEDLCYWRWVRISSNVFLWNAFSKQSCVRFWHLYNDIHQKFALTISHSPSKFKVVLLGKGSMYNYDNEK